MGPRPFMWYLMFNVCLQYVYLGLVRGEFDPVVSQFHPVFLYLWYYGMIFSTLSLLVGSIIFRKVFLGLTLQRVGSLVMGLLSAANVVLILLVLDLSVPQIFLAFVSITTFTICSFIHFWDVGNHMERITRITRAVVESDPS